MRLPIRVRLTAWYALLLAVILAAMGAFLVLRLRSDLRSTIYREVRTSSATISGNYAHEGIDGFREISAAALPRSGAATQVLDKHGRVLIDYGGAVAGTPMVPASARAAALRGNQQLLSLTLGSSRQPFLAMATRVREPTGDQLVVVAESLEGVGEAVRRILILLLIAGPVALATAGLLGWLLLRSALRPVVRMTKNAEQIGIDRLSERLAAPNPNDEIGELAATLNAMLDRLESGVEQKRRLIADASHELRTPLAVIRAEIDVRLKQEELPPSERALLESVREETDRLTRSVDNLLTLAQADEGGLPLLPVELDLRETVDAAAGQLRGLAAAKRLELTTAGGACPAVGDSLRLELAVTNLIENAIKFTAPGGSVTASCWRRGNSVGVTVTDTGAGIPTGAREEIFDRFVRARAPASGHVATDGSGLGLAICREIATAHGGTVSVESQEGRGSAFTIALPAPVLAGEANADYSSPSEPTPAAPRATSR